MYYLYSIILILVDTKRLYLYIFYLILNIKRKIYIVEWFV